MKKLIPLLVLLSSPAYAGCPSGDAATLGSQAGYQRDIQAAAVTAQNDRNSSDMLGKCISGITGVFGNTPFPTLAQIFANIKNQVCQAASNEVTATVNMVTSTVTSSVSQVTSPISSQVNSGLSSATTGLPLPAPINLTSPVNTSVVTPTLQTTPASSNTWTTIFK